jgi:hypothetical protein
MRPAYGHRREARSRLEAGNDKSEIGAATAVFALEDGTVEDN